MIQSCDLFHISESRMKDPWSSSSEGALPVVPLSSLNSCRYESILADTSKYSGVDVLVDPRRYSFGIVEKVLISSLEFAFES